MFVISNLIYTLEDLKWDKTFIYCKKMNDINVNTNQPYNI